MKPGMIITSYKTVDDTLRCNLHNENQIENHVDSEMVNIEKLSLKIMEESRQKARIEYQQIIESANSILNEAKMLQKTIEEQYLENLKFKYNVDTESYLKNKSEEFNKLINLINSNFTSIQIKSQNDILDILLNTYKAFFGEEFKNPEKIKNMICNNFYGFDNCKESELILSKELFENFNTNLKQELEEELNIVVDNVKYKRNLSGFILNTDLGSIECDLEKQIESLKEQLEISK